MTPETLTWIERKKPTLVGWAEVFVKETELFEPRPTKKDHKKNSKDSKKKPFVSGSQLRNLLNAAQNGSSLAVLINFLRYQLGREKNAWDHKKSGKALEELLDKELRELAENAAGENAAGDDREAARYEIEAHLAAQLMGFIIREYTYRCSLAGTKP